MKDAEDNDEPIVRREGPRSQIPPVPSLVILEATDLDLDEPGSADPFPGEGSIDPMSVDQRDPRSESTSAPDDVRLVNRQLTEPADLGSYQLSQTARPPAK